MLARPIENAYLIAILGRDARAILAEQTCYVHRDESDAIDGFINFAPNVVLAGANEQAARTFAARARLVPRPRMIVGPRPIVSAFWRALQAHTGPARIVRDRQPLLVLKRSALRAAPSATNVRQAHAAEAELIAEHSARMIATELGYDPRETRSSYGAGVAHAIERGWWWVLIEDGALLFMCNVGIATAQTAQLQGVWTPPAARERGHATRALAAICGRLLESFPTISLYVNDFNAPALALYDRLGFKQVGEFSTVLL